MESIWIFLADRKKYWLLPSLVLWPIVLGVLGLIQVFEIRFEMFRYVGF